MRSVRPILILTACALSPLLVQGAELDEFKVKREEIFEFDEKPKVVRKEQKEFEIAFSSRAGAMRLWLLKARTAGFSGTWPAACSALILQRTYSPWTTARQC